VCLSTTADAQCPIQLTDLTKQTGIAFVHTDGSSGQRYIVESVCCGLALLDYDSDGDEDIYFLNGAPLPGTDVMVPPKNALYRNDGNWKFTDVTERAGVGDTGYGLGVCAGDYDNDGDQDIYLNNFGPNVLFRNNGDGTFSDVTKKTGVGNGRKVGAGACFLDMDKDGDLDLYVANYVDFTYQKHQTRLINGFPAYVGPMQYGPVPDTLYRNEGNGTFTDVSARSGIAAHSGTGMGMTCGDYDDDGDTDVVVGNDAAANFALRNEGAGKFREVGLQTGLAFDLHGIGHGTMGVECGDYNNDGRLDFEMTSYHEQLATLYENLGHGVFEDVTRRTRAGTDTRAAVTWGNGLVDFDNDGNRDLFIACGHLQDNIERWDDTKTYASRNLLLMNDGNGKFVNVSNQCGDGLAARFSSRGAAFGDLDNDGDIDVVILNSRRQPTILRNDSTNKNHWIQIRLCGRLTNRDGVGARVKVIVGEQTYVDEVHSGRGYQSHYGTRLHFGLGQADHVDRIEVRWIGGGLNVFENINSDQVVTLTEIAPRSGDDP
jgi:hypothetical protein